MTKVVKKRQIRAGTTRNVSVSLTSAVLEILRERAEANHGGNLSAAIAEAAEVLRRHAARDVVAKELMKGRPPLTDQDRRLIDAELEAGWALARRHAKKRKSAA